MRTPAGLVVIATGELEGRAGIRAVDGLRCDLRRHWTFGAIRSTLGCGSVPLRVQFSNIAADWRRTLPDRAPLSFQL